jgi:aspartyl-tRNA(Asn)/glutamyl-tRNA(Gln) amidotransferase subunit A
MEQKRRSETMKLTRREFGILAGSAALAEAALAGWGSKAWATETGGDSLAAMTLGEASAMIHAGKVTPTELTMACLDRIAVYAPKLDCFITVMREKALAQAAVLDAEQKAGNFRGPLHGIPIALKDNIDTAGTLTTAGSGVFRDRIPTEDAPVVTRLVAAGAIILGKTNLHEFAMGGGDVSYFGPARNPWNLAHNTGGSSSGSGAAVAADLCFAALGTDTGGSVRMPSAYCADVGIKPTYGLVPIRGIVPLTATRDHCGPLAKRVEDAAMMLNVMAGYDKLDIFSVEHPKENYVEGMKQVSVKDIRLGIPKGAFEIPKNPHAYTGPGSVKPASPEVIAVVKTAIDLLGTMTAGPAKEVELPPPNYRPPDPNASAAEAKAGDPPGDPPADGKGSAPAPAAAATAGAAGIMGGGETFAYHEEYFKEKSELYQPTTRKRLEQAALAHQSAADYVRQLEYVELLRRTIDDAFTDFDLVVMPTLKTEPPLLDDMIRRNIMMVDGLLPVSETTPGGGGGGGGTGGGGISSVGAYDAYGIPSLSIPCGFTQDGLPVGLMICGPHFTESKIFALAAAYEKATQWHTMKPPLTPNTPVPELLSHL